MRRRESSSLPLALLLLGGRMVERPRRLPRRSDMVRRRQKSCADNKSCDSLRLGARREHRTPRRQQQNSTGHHHQNLNCIIYTMPNRPHRHTHTHTREAMQTPHITHESIESSDGLRCTAFWKDTRIYTNLPVCRGPLPQAASVALVIASHCFPKPSRALRI